MDEYRIDSHKLIYHPERVTEWLKEGDCYPIYIEVSPSGKCNHRCIFCALDYMGYDNPTLDTQMLISRLDELHFLGLKSVMFAGEGEPLLHPEIRTIIGSCWDIGLDTSVTTNGVLLDKIIPILHKLSWVRVSVDAGTPSTYAKIHGTKKEDFQKVIDNLEEAVTGRNTENTRTTIGAQLLLIEDNWDEVETLSHILDDIGVDYLSIKPYSQHPDSNSMVRRVTPGTITTVRKFSGAYDGSIMVNVRENAFARSGVKRTYKKCLGLPFFCYISSLGEVYPCSTYLGNREFVYGNIYTESFRAIWKGPGRQKVLKRINSLDISTCRENCRLDPINQYLWELKEEPPAHVNFI